MPFPDSKIVIDAIDRSLSSVGSEEFSGEWMEALNTFLKIDHFSILHYSRKKGSRILLSHGGYSDAEYNEIAGDYERECDRDPYFRRMMSTSPYQDGHAIHIPLSNFSDKEYVNYFYERLNIVDKCSLITGVGLDRLLTSFYRFSPSDLFTKKDWELVESIGPLFNKIALTHFQFLGMLPQPKAKPSESDMPHIIHATMGRHRKEFAQLSERERNICEFILLGYRAEDIANELNIANSSVVTYRKRAYAKLGISSQKDLFHILLK